MNDVWPPHNISNQWLSSFIKFHSTKSLPLLSLPSIFSASEMDDSALQIWDYLSSDLTESIFSHLPILSIVRAAAVCKIWRSIIVSSAFAARVSAAKQPWFFLCGHHNVFLKNNRAFAFDPEANRWIVLSNSTTIFSQDLFAGSNGFFFAASATAFSFRPILRGAWRQARALRFSRCSPLVGVFNDGGSELPRFIVVGGVKFVGSLVDIEDRLAVEIYNPCSDSWELCPPLPPEFNTLNSSQSLCSALFNQKFFVLGIHSFFISSFNLKTRQWSGVQTLQPPGAQSGFLISSNDRLILAGLCNSPAAGAEPSFNLWKIDEETMEFSEMAIMPPELLRLLLHGDEDDNRPAAGLSLKCVGLGSLIYVFNEEHQRNYPACVCEIKKLESGECYGDWRKLPSLPVLDGNKFHRVISFCSSVSLDNVLD